MSLVYRDINEGEREVGSETGRRPGGAEPRGGGDLADVDAIL